MRLVIAAVGKLKDGPERELIGRYQRRLALGGRALALTPVDFLETVEGRADSAHVRRDDEAQRLLRLVGSVDAIVALDETGSSMGSAGFAALIAKQRDAGVGSLAFLIGGPDGHGSAVTAKAMLKLAFGPMTLPHGLARVVLAEQLYRATTILSGHPYHRA